MAVIIFESWGCYEEEEGGMMSWGLGWDERVDWLAGGRLVSLFCIRASFFCGGGTSLLAFSCLGEGSF